MTNNYKICSINIDVSDVIINKTPILFLVTDVDNDGEIDAKDAIIEHIDELLNLIYKYIDDTKDLTCLDDIKLNYILYELNTDNDQYETDKLSISNYIDLNNNVLIDIIKNNIKEYVDALLNKIHIDIIDNESLSNTYARISNNNEQQILPETFIQYIMSCMSTNIKNKELLNLTYKILNNEIL